MRYLCLVYVDEKELEALTSRESDALAAESRAYEEGIRTTGHFVMAHTLQSIQTATTVRVRNSELSLTDGPFAETKEQLGRFILIEARDLNDAIRVASKIPLAQVGSIEVRPL